MYRHVAKGSHDAGQPHWLFRGPDGGWFVGERAHIGTNQGAISSEFAASHPLAVATWMYADKLGWVRDSEMSIEIVDERGVETEAEAALEEAREDRKTLAAVSVIVVEAVDVTLIESPAGDAPVFPGGDDAQLLATFGPGREGCDGLMGTYILDSTLGRLNGAPVFKQLIDPGVSLNTCAYLSRGGSDNGYRGWCIGELSSIGRCRQSYISTEGPAVSPIQRDLMWQVWSERVAPLASEASTDAAAGAVAMMAATSCGGVAMSDGFVRIIFILRKMCDVFLDKLCYDSYMI